MTLLTTSTAVKIHPTDLTEKNTGIKVSAPKKVSEWKFSDAANRMTSYGNTPEPAPWNVWRNSKKLQSLAENASGMPSRKSNGWMTEAHS